MVIQIIKILIYMVLSFAAAVFLEMLINTPDLKRKLREAEEELNDND